jgi:hypothetical protein
MRLTWPELAGMGATPASIANASASPRQSAGTSTSSSSLLLEREGVAGTGFS